MNKTITHCFSFLLLFVLPTRVAVGFISPTMPLSLGDFFWEGIESSELSLEEYEVCIEEEAFLRLPVSCLEADSLELVALYEATGGENWTNTVADNQKWLQGLVEDWYGVTLSADGCSVEVLQLSNNNLTGSLTDLQLPQLKRLYLSWNNLTGEIPNFNNLLNLTTLWLYGTNLSGEIPNFNNLPQLRNLQLQLNSLSGEIPNFNNLPNLISLYLYDNNLSGEIPDFNNLPNLVNLWLQENNLSGEIPDFNNLPNLQMAWLHKNKLSGEIPDFTNLPNLISLVLSSNQLSGEIPDFTNLPNLIYLVLSSNQLSGIVPNFTNIPNLTLLSLDNNQLSGIIPNFTNLSNLTSLYINSNKFIFSDILNTWNFLINVGGCFESQAPCIQYAPQDTLPISQAENTLYVQAGGNLADNHYTWYKDGVIMPNMPTSGDSTLAINESGTYRVEVTNDIVTNPDVAEQNLILVSEELYISTEEICSPETDGTIWVTTTEDNGNDDNPTGGSLRAAIKCANETIGANTIKFNLIGTAPFVFQPTVAYPTLIDSLTIIDGTTQTGWSLGDIEVDGSLTSIGNGLTLTGNRCEVYGLHIHDFPDSGIRLHEAKESTLKNNTISNNSNNGIYISGFANSCSIENNTVSNNSNGIYISGFANSCSIENNTVSNNSNNGIYISSFADSCIIENNTVSNNSNNGIYISSFADSCIIENNTVSNNSNNGIHVDIAGFCTIKNNKIGTSLDGMDSLPNKNGILIQRSSNSTIQNNLISSNLESGIYIYQGSGYITVESNKIGTAIDGISPMPNGDYGIRFTFASHHLYIGNTLGTGTNIIAHNPIGIQVEASTSYCKIHQNSIFCNTTKGISTSLYPSPNITNTNTNIISGTSAANDTIEVFLHDDTSCNGVPCQGKTYLGTTYTNENGDWSLSEFTEPIEAGQQVVATATNINTSAFSDCESIVCSASDLALAQEPAFCGRESITLSTTAEYNFLLWSTGAMTPSIIVNETGWYSLEVFDANGCSQEIEFEVTENSLLDLVIEGNLEVCPEEITILQAVTANEYVASYLWSNGATAQSISLFPNLDNSAVYTVTVTSEGGCSATASAKITTKPSPTAIIETSCNESIATLTASGGTQYVWSNGSTAESIVVDASNFVTYTVSVSNNEGCAAVAETTLLCNCLTEDSLELVRFYEATGGQNWTDKSGWLVASLSEWYGVTLSEDGCSVEGLHLMDNGLSGSLIDLNLQGLTVLSLRGNELNNSIPNFTNLPKLTHLTLDSNQLSGEIPNFKNLPNLLLLNLSQNQLTGVVPNFLYLPNLTGLWLYNNQLTGKIPNFTDLSNLSILSLGGNKLTGIVPDFDNLAQLTYLSLGNNYFIFSDILNAWEFVLNMEECTPETCLKYVPQATIALHQPSNNKLSVKAGDVANNTYYWYKNGVPKDTVKAHSTYTIIESGTYRVEVTNETVTNPNIEEQNLILTSEERFIEVIPLDCPELATDSLALVDFYQKTDGENWANKSGWLTAPVDTWYGVTVNPEDCSVEHLNLPHNQLTGLLPNLDLPNLKTLNLGGNQLTGLIPNFTGLFELQYLNLGNNQFEDFVTEFTSLHNLQELHLNDNQLFGEIPDFLDLEKLEILNLAGNELEGSIPNFSKLQLLQELYLEENHLTGLVPQFSNLPNLQKLEFQHNRFVFADILKGWNFISNLQDCEQEEDILDFCALYAPQDTILPLHHIKDTLYVIASDLEHNSYTWYKNGEVYDIQEQDSTLVLTETGNYYVEVRNSDISQNSPSQNLILRSEELNIPVLSDPSKCGGAIALDPLVPKEYGMFTHFGSYDPNHLNQIETPNCFTDGKIDNNTWFTFLGDGNTYSIDVVDCGGILPLKEAQMAIYEGPDCANLTFIDCTEGSISTPQTTLKLPTIAEKRYFLLIDGYENHSGLFCIEVSNGNCEIDNNGSISVTTLEDNGNDYEPISGSLRAAIICANNSEGPNQIYFDPNQIAASPPYRIQPQSPLPILTDTNTTIDGNYSFNAIENFVELDGSLLNSPSDSLVGGLRLQGANCSIQGFFIHSFPNHGIVIDACEGCQIGDFDNSQKGNTISGNAYSGILVNAESKAIGIHHNKIGTDVAGGNALPNKLHGIRIKGAAQIEITSNLLSGNVKNGLFSKDTEEILIANNQIGTNTTGTQKLGNGKQGVYLISGVDIQFIGNLISGNIQNGVQLNRGEKALLQENLIGTDITGTQALGNGLRGVRIIEVTDSIVIQENVMSGNIEGGIQIEDIEAVSLLSNKIGTNAAGNQKLGNYLHGIEITGVLTGSSYLHNNVIADNEESGILIQRSMNTILDNNFIGTDSSRSLTMPNESSGVFIKRSENTSLAQNTIFHQETGVLIQGIAPALCLNTHLLGDTIAHNETGIKVKKYSDSYVFNQNSIYCNAVQGIDIETETDEIAPPIILEASNYAAYGTAEPFDTIEIFIHNDVECEGMPCQGKTYIGTAYTNPNGDWELNNYLVSVNDQQLVATATNKKTSEFSTCFEPTVCPSPEWSTETGILEVCEADLPLKIIPETAEGTWSCEGVCDGFDESCLTNTDGEWFFNYEFTETKNSHTIELNYTTTCDSNTPSNCIRKDLTVYRKPSILSVEALPMDTLCFPVAEAQIEVATDLTDEGQLFEFKIYDQNDDLITSNFSTSLAFIDFASFLNTFGEHRFGVRVVNGLCESEMVEVRFFVEDCDNTSTDCSAIIDNEGYNCETNAYILTASPGDTDPLLATYSWSNNEDSQSIEANTTGVYTVTITDENDCTSTAMTQLTVTPAALPSIEGNLKLCQNESTVLNTGDFSSYSWSNGASTQSIEVNEAGIYAVTVTDFNDCTHIAAEIVEAYELLINADILNSNITPSPAVVTNDTIIINENQKVRLFIDIFNSANISVTNNLNFSEITWTANGTQINGFPTLSEIVSPNETTTYTVNATTTDDCILTGEVTIEMVAPAYDCIEAFEVCNTTPIIHNSTNKGTEEGSFFCIEKEHYATWFKIPIGSQSPANAKLAFAITPNDGEADCDFEFFRAIDGCDDLEELRCSVSSSSITGLNEVSNEEGPDMDGDGFSRFVETSPGEVYYLLVDIHSGNYEGFTLEWTGNAVFNCDPIPECENPAPTLASRHCENGNHYLETSQSEGIQWYNNAGLNEVIQTGNILVVNAIGVYYVTQTLEGCEGEVLEVEVTEEDLYCPAECPNNLVPNYSFEEKDVNQIDEDCSISAGAIRAALGWDSQINAFKKADYFNACNTGNYGIPANELGFQEAYKEGNAYVGTRAYKEQNALRQREFIQVPLSNSLKIGQTYCVSMQVSLAESSSYAIDKIGMYFSTHKTSEDDIEIPLTPQVVHQELLENTTNWMEIRGSFTATEAFEYLSIGNFATHNNLKTINNSGNGLAYYYIDAIEVRPTNQIEFLSIFSEGSLLNPNDNTAYICPDASIVLEAHIDNQDFACAWGWIENETDTIHQFIHTGQPIEDTTIYHFWVNNGLCEVVDSLVVIWGEDTGEGNCGEPNCLTAGGNLSLINDEESVYCDAASITPNLTGHNENLITNYLFLSSDDSEILCEPLEEGTYCLVAVNSPESIECDNTPYTYLVDIEAAIENGACMALSNAVCFEISSIPSAPSNTNIYCNGISPYIELLQGENIRWYDTNDLANNIEVGNPFEVNTAGTYYATQTVNGCESEALEVTITEADLYCPADCPDNLVPNYSFEEYGEGEDCPGFAGDIPKVVFWRSPANTSEEADYFNSCNENESSYNTPENILGFQEPSDGEAYAGLKAYSMADSNGEDELINREFIQTQLIEPLEAGQSYCVSMKVSLAERSQFAIDNLGIYFSSNTITGNDIEAILEPQVVHQGLITNTSDWIEIKGSFVASDNLQYLAIGNFAPNNGVQEINSTGNGEAYYYIDMIEVRPTNQIESVTVFQEGVPLTVLNDTVIVCPDNNITLEAVASQTNFACSWGWIEGSENLTNTDTTHQMTYTFDPQQDSMAYRFWVNNGLCEIADDLVVVFAQNSENEECELSSSCEQIHDFMTSLEDLTIEVPYQMSGMKIEWAAIIEAHIDELADSIGFNKNLLANIQTSAIMSSLNTSCKTEFYDIRLTDQTLQYTNKDTLNYGYVGLDQFTYKLYHPSCGSFSRTLNIDIQCPAYGINEATSDCDTASFRMSFPELIIYPNHAINLIEANSYGWSFQYKIEGVHDDWQPSSSDPVDLSPNTAYAVSMRVVTPQTGLPIFHGSNAEHCFTWLETPNLKTFPVAILEDCSNNEEVILLALIEGLENVNPDDYKITWSTGDTTQQIQVIPPFEEAYWVEIERLEDGCMGIDTAFHVGPPQINIDYPYTSRCAATISVKHQIPQSIFCHNEEVPKEHCRWDAEQQSYICDLRMLETSEEIAEVIVIDHKGCSDTLPLFDCMPKIKKIIPNPFWASCMVELTGIPTNRSVSYNIYSIDGRLVFQGTVANSRSIKIDTENQLISGLYFIEFLIGNIEGRNEPAFRLTEKLIKMGIDR